MGIFTKIFGSQIEKDLAANAEKAVEKTVFECFQKFDRLEVMQGQLWELKREKETLSEDIAREKLDLKHKLGLERMRQQQEAEIAKERLQAQREAIGAERDLAVQGARFEAKAEALEESRQMMDAFQDRQEKMIEHLLEALPSAELFKTVEG